MGLSGCARMRLTARLRRRWLQSERGHTLHGGIAPPRELHALEFARRVNMQVKLYVLRADADPRHRDPNP